ncbi:efflux RND transporter permease subunit [Oceanobacillus senegalensis]|uniref:efflux RND transporter permease subunit n=1 Tax=Oceanobacillus senegalensis TaxID=1936063 RepID=UPI000A31002F|nr:efflux RND transporter permease subunit [Oceanobacillus senegalensis]
MNRLVNTSIKRPVAVIMLVIVALLLGTISLRDLKVDLFPEIDLPIAVVATTYQGAAPQEVEELVTDPIEAAVGTIEGLDTVQSTSQESSSLVIMSFNFDKNIDKALSDIREKVDQVEGQLPDNANAPTIMRLDPNAMPVVFLSLSGAPLNELQDLAEDAIQPAIERGEGVASATVTGGVEREIRIELNQAQLEQFGITGAQVSQTLAAENRSVSAGSVERGSQDISIRIDGKYTSIDDIRNTQITLSEGNTITIDDVAEVKDTFKERSSIATLNGEETLSLSVMKQSDANTVDVANEVMEIVEKINAQYEERGIEVGVIMDTSEFIVDSMDSVVSNMIIGGVLAAIILLVFLRSVKTTLVIGVSMPIAIISTFTLMYFTGESLNVLSMGGLALGIGMMVDSSIVILENIFKKKEEGLSIMEAASEGGTELAGAVLASTLTTIAVFLPMILVDGIAAELFTPLSSTVIFALSMSLITALTLIPMLSSKLLGNVKVSFDDENPKGIVNKMLSWIKNIYGNILEKALRFRKTVAFIVMVIVIGSLALIPALGFELQPAADSGQAQITVTTQTGSTLETSVETVNQVTATLDEHYSDVIDFMFVNAGGDLTGTSGGDSSQSTIMLELIDVGERDITTQEFVTEANDLLDNIPGAEVVVAESSTGAMSSGSPISITINGDNLDVLGDLAQQVVWLAEDVEGTMNVDSSVEDGNPEVQVVVNRELASSYGLSYQQVMNELSLALNGETATRYKEDGKEYDVTVALPEEDTATIRDLETMTIRNSQGVDIPLRAVAELRQIQGPATINRSDQQRGVTVTADIAAGSDLGTVTQEIQTQLNQMALPDGYTIDIGGESEQMMEAFGQLILALALGVFLVYTVMAIQFESFTYPFIIMFSMPTMIIGVILGLFITGVPVSTVALIGLIMLAGIVVNNGIILVDYINILRERGWDRTEAIIESGKSRLRPILMTTLTTVLAMVPMAMGIGEGSETQQPMAITVVFGLLTSTIFTLVFVPVMYVMVDNTTNTFKRLMKRVFSRRKKDELEEEIGA